MPATQYVLNTAVIFQREKEGNDKAINFLVTSSDEEVKETEAF